MLNPKVLGVDPKALLYKVPGGMLSNLLNQLKEMRIEDRYADVLAEVPRVRADYGLSAAGHAAVPDGGHAGHDERRVGRALQDRAVRDPRLRARYVLDVRPCRSPTIFGPRSSAMTRW